MILKGREATVDSFMAWLRRDSKGRRVTNANRCMEKGNRPTIEIIIQDPMPGRSFLQKHSTIRCAGDASRRQRLFVAARVPQMSEKTYEDRRKSCDRPSNIKRKIKIVDRKRYRGPGKFCIINFLEEEGEKIKKWEVT